MKLSHVNNSGAAHMVDISPKGIVHREAEAAGKIFVAAATLELIRANKAKKGDVLAVARVAGISAAKKTSDLIPLCHNILINQVTVSFALEADGIRIRSRAVCDGRTGIEMEALTAVSVAALTIYDMCKAADKNMRIGEISLVKKTKS